MNLFRFFHNTAVKDCYFSRKVNDPTDPGSVHLMIDCMRLANRAIILCSKHCDTVRCRTRMHFQFAFSHRTSPKSPSISPQNRHNAEGFSVVSFSSNYFNLFETFKSAKYLFFLKSFLVVLFLLVLTGDILVWPAGLILSQTVHTIFLLLRRSSV